MSAGMDKGVESRCSESGCIGKLKREDSHTDFEQSQRFVAKALLGQSFMFLRLLS